MKRWISLLVLTALLFSLAGCEKKEEPKPQPTMSSQDILAMAWQMSMAQSQQRKQQAQISASSDLRISEVKVNNNGSSSTRCSGRVTNNSSSITYKFVKVKGAFKSASGQVLDTDWTYAAGAEGLAPGESCTFSMSVDKDYKISKCDVTLLDADT